MKYRYLRVIIVMTSLCLSMGSLFGQSSGTQSSEREYYNPPQIGGLSTVITPDARGAGMAGIGVATSADVHSLYHNVSKFGFVQKTWGVSFSYTPWLTEIAKDMGISYLSGYYAWGDEYRQAVTGAFKYFDIGEALFFPKQQQAAPLVIKPFELSADLGYAIRLHPMWSVGAAVRYLRSDLNAETIISGGKEGPKSVKHLAHVLMFDISVSHQSEVRLFGADMDFRAGLAINNMGEKLSYDGGKTYLFSPTILRLGAGLDYKAEEMHQVSFGIELDKYLAPSIPLPTDADHAKQRDKLRRMSAFKGILHSFGDAPGGFAEELKEISLASGVEYVYDKMFFARLGWRYQHPSKGNNSGLSLGVGILFSNITFDVSYFTGLSAHNPLNNTMRLSLGFSL